MVGWGSGLLPAVPRSLALLPWSHAHRGREGRARSRGSARGGRSGVRLACPLVPSQRGRRAAARALGGEPGSWLAGARPGRPGAGGLPAGGATSLAPSPRGAAQPCRTSAAGARRPGGASQRAGHPSRARGVALSKRAHADGSRSPHHGRHDGLSRGSRRPAGLPGGSSRRGGQHHVRSSSRGAPGSGLPMGRAASRSHGRRRRGRGGAPAVFRRARRGGAWAGGVRPASGRRGLGAAQSSSSSTGRRPSRAWINSTPSSSSCPAPERRISASPCCVSSS